MRARKQDREIPDASGVYQIRCKSNGKIYVGSAVNLRARWDTHRRDLRRGLHHNSYLQRAWDRCGESGFELVVLEYVEVARLSDTEQLWIDFTGCLNRCVGYNIKPEASCSGLGIGRTWLGFRDPNGNAVRQRDYIKTHDGFVDPDGQRVAPIRNLAAFCRERGLVKTHMTAVASGRIVSHQGWTHVRGRKRLPPPVHKGFIAPGGAVVRITNLSAFCRACELCLVHMFELKSGRRPSHKGWIWKHDADQAFE
jgi:GIY-YIG catalytic domain